MPRWWAFLTRYAIVFAGVGAIFAGYSIFIANIHWPLFYDACDLMLWTMIFATWILLSNSSTWFATALDFRFTHFIASRSYSLYLLHIDAIAVGKRFNDLPLVLKMILTWGIAFAAAEVLHRMVERPGIQAREWFRISRSRSQTKAVSPR